ncbi:MAG: flagellar hook-length control protein FliK [Bacillota bacterium]|jgi:hypothetical protein|nr:hypothetical protein [Candidatus Fermentithermobacillaceae bacterium]
MFPGLQAALDVVTGNQALPLAKAAAALKHSAGKRMSAETFASAMAVAMGIVPPAVLTPYGSQWAGRTDPMEPTEPTEPTEPMGQAQAVMAGLVDISPAQTGDRHGESLWEAGDAFAATAGTAEPSQSPAPRTPVPTVFTPYEAAGGRDTPVTVAKPTVIPGDTVFPPAVSGTQMMEGGQLEQPVDATVPELPREEESVILTQYEVKRDHVLPEAPAGSSMARARLAVRLPDAGERTGAIVSGEEVAGPPETGEEAQFPSREAGFEPPEEIGTTAEVTEERVYRESHEDEEEPLTGVTASAKALTRAEHVETAFTGGTREEPVPAQGEVSLRDTRALAEHLRAEALKKLPRSVELRLDPPHLGSVTAILSARGQNIAVKFVSGSLEAGRALDASAQELAEALNDLGLTLAGFSVDHGDPQGEAPRGERGRSAASGWRRERRIPGHEAVTGQSVTAPYSAARYGGHLDYIV